MSCPQCNLARYVLTAETRAASECVAQQWCYVVVLPEWQLMIEQAISCADFICIYHYTTTCSYHLHAEEGEGMVNTVKCKFHLDASEIQVKFWSQSCASNQM